MIGFESNGPYHVTADGVPLGLSEGVKMQMIPHIRWMIRRDLPDVLQIEQDSYDQPWRESDFTLALRDRNTIGMVAQQGETVIGFMVYQLRPRSVYVFDLAVAPSWRRLGVGLAMLNAIKKKLRPATKAMPARRRIIVELPESNVPGQLFLKAQGFRCIKQNRRFFDTGEDGYVMEYRTLEEEVEPVKERQCETGEEEQ